MTSARPSSSIPISILIPTLGRTDPLWNTVRALLPLLGSGDEILIVDQNNPPMPWPPDCAHPAVRRIALDKPGLTRARNAALQAARNAWVLFLDDDIAPDPGLMDAARSACALPGKVAYAGRVRQLEGPEGMVGVGGFERNTGAILTDFRKTPSGVLPFFPGGCCCYSKNILPQNGPAYCPWFRGAAMGEEIDLALRLRKKGVSIIGLPEMAIDHLKVPQGGCRTPEYQARFARHHVFNSALIFARHGLIYKPQPFLHRMRGFIEFHSRISEPGKATRHSWPQALVLVCQIPTGWVLGIAWKIWNLWGDRA